MNPIQQTFIVRLADGLLGHPIGFLADDIRDARRRTRQRIRTAQANGAVLYRRDFRGQLQVIATFGEVIQ